MKRNGPGGSRLAHREWLHMLLDPSQLQKKDVLGAFRVQGCVCVRVRDFNDPFQAESEVGLKVQFHACGFLMAYVFEPIKPA